jgi:hypothetical protein
VKHFLILISLTGLLASCGNKEQASAPTDSTTNAPAQDTTHTTAAPPYVFFNIDSLKDVIEAGKKKQDQELAGDPSKIKGYLNTLPGSDPTSIPYAIHYIKHHPAQAGSLVYDSLYKQFSSLYYLVSVAFSKVVAGPTCEVVLRRNHIEQLSSTDPIPEDPELKNLVAYLNLYSLKIYNSEGGYYTGADPDLYYNTFGRKGSPQLVYYLHLQQKDLKEGFVDDNMLLITYPQLYQRIEAWGAFIAAHADGFLRQEAVRTYRGYLSALLIGVGNTPTFDSEKQTLNPEIKTLYETIMASSKDRVSKKIITDYYSFLSQNDFKRTDAVNTFLAQPQYDIVTLFSQPI